MRKRHSNFKYVEERSAVSPRETGKEREKTKNKKQKKLNKTKQKANKF